MTQCFHPRHPPTHHVIHAGHIGGPSVGEGDPPLAGCNCKVKKLFCFELDAMSVPEALATTIRILLMFSIVLVHRWNPGVWARPTPSGTPHRHPWAPPGHTPPTRPARLTYGVAPPYLGQGPHTGGGPMYGVSAA